MNQRKADTRGFTLVEILIVVVILGILAAIVIPQFTSAAESSRQNSIKMDVNRIRTQIFLYQQQHNGDFPTLDNFEVQMTLASNPTGATAPVGTAGYLFGPYIQQVPINPSTGTRDVGTGAVGSSAWYYDENSGDFHANDSAETRGY